MRGCRDRTASWRFAFRRSNSRWAEPPAAAGRPIGCDPGSTAIAVGEGAASGPGAAPHAEQRVVRLSPSHHALVVGASDAAQPEQVAT